jgi:hypothetical protein
MISRARVHARARKGASVRTPFPLAKTVADLTCSQNSTVRQQIIETLMREIMEYDAEFRREDASGAVSSVVRH